MLFPIEFFSDIYLGEAAVLWSQGLENKDLKKGRTWDL